VPHKLPSPIACLGSRWLLPSAPRDPLSTKWLGFASIYPATACRLVISNDYVFEKSDDGQIKYALSNAPKEISLSEVEIVQYHLQRNLTACKSHPKKRVDLAKFYNTEVSL
jgi:hypothetical protein